MCEFIMYYMQIEKTKCGSSTEVHSFGRHQTHAMVGPGFGEMTHCGPLVLFRVVQEHLVSRGAMARGATCSASGVKIMMVCTCTILYIVVSMFSTHRL